MDIFSLEKLVCHYYMGGVAERTRNSYSSAQHRYLNFCHLYSLSPLPLSEGTVCLFAAYLAHQVTSPPVRGHCLPVCRLLGSPRAATYLNFCIPVCAAAPTDSIGPAASLSSRVATPPVCPQGDIESSAQQQKEQAAYHKRSVAADPSSVGYLDRSGICGLNAVGCLLFSLLRFLEILRIYTCGPAGDTLNSLK